MKKTSKAISTLLAVSILLGLSGCVNQLADIPIAGNLKVSKAALKSMPQQKNVKGTAVAHIPIIPVYKPKVEDAIEDALKNGDGDVLINAKAYSWWWWYLYGQHRIVVEGTVINTKAMK